MDERANLKRAIDLSHNDRQERNDTHDGQKKESFQESINYLYGEVTRVSMNAIIDSVLPYITSDQTEFWDLGSGSGRAVFCAASRGLKFRRIVGIEILPRLHDMAVSELSERQDDGVVTLECGDFLTSPTLAWKTVEHPPIVWVCSTAFSEALLKKIAQKCSFLPQGSVVLTVSYALPSHLYDVMWKRQFQMSWGEGTVFMQRRNAHHRIESVILKNFYHRK